MSNQLPWDERAEAACVSAAMLDPRRYDECAGLLDARRFHSSANAAIWQAIGEIRAGKRDVDIVTVMRWCKANGKTPFPVSPTYLGEVIDSTPAVENIASHASIVFDCWRLRQIHRVASETAAKVSVDRIEDVVAFAADTLRAFEAAGRPAATSGSCWLGDGIRSAFERIGSRVESGRSMIGESTGFPTLDLACGGMARKRVYTLGARAGMGKTAFAICVALNLASRGMAGLFVSLEMGREEIATRALTAWSKVSLDPIKYGRAISQSGWSDLAKAAGELSKIPLVIDDSTGLTVPKIRAKVTQLQAELARSGKSLFFVTIDHASRIQSVNPRLDKRQQIVEITGGIKDMAKDLDVAVLLLAQLNRSLEARTVKDKRPRISDLRESGSFEEDADQVWLLYRGDKYEADKSKHTGEAELILAKVRDDGEEGFVKLSFDGPTRRFFEEEP